jgi:hypothetical protein
MDIDSDSEKNTFTVAMIRPGEIDMNRLKASVTIESVELDNGHWLEQILVDMMDTNPYHHVIDCTTIRESFQRVFQMFNVADYKLAEVRDKAAVPDNRNLMAEYLMPSRDRPIYGAVIIIANGLDNWNVPYNGTFSEKHNNGHVEFSDIKKLISTREEFTVTDIIVATNSYTSKQMDLATLQELRNKWALEESKDDEEKKDDEVGEVSHLEVNYLGDSGWKLLAWQSAITPELNKTATRILGKRVYGDWTFASQAGEDMFDDLTREHIELFSNFAACPLDMISEPPPLPVPVGDMESEDYQRKLDHIKNRVLTKHYLMRLKIESLTHGCAQCSNDNVPLNYCTDCYRLRYCSVDCQRKHRAAHKADCKQSR